MSLCQIAFGINPEAPEDLVSANSEVFASSAVFHDPLPTFAAKVRSIARQNVLAYKDKLTVLEACLKEVDEASKKARDAAAQGLESAE